MSSAFASAAQTSPVGPGWRGGPGYFRVPIVAAAPRGVVLSGGLAYGFTESQVEAPGSHHRVGGRIAAAVTPLDWLNLTLGTNFRHDRHSADDDLGSDQGTVIDSDLSAQAGQDLGSDLHVGMAVGASFVRGASVARSLESPALDVQVLGAYLPRASAFSVGMLAGFRYDRSAGAVLDPALYRAGDRLALGVSDFNAVPVGVGASYRLGATDFIAELSADVLVGSGAPGLERSPLRASAGARHRLSDSVALRLMTETALGARAPTGAADPMVPVEPRFQVLLAVAYDLLRWDGARTQGVPARPAVEALPLPPEPAPAAALCTLQVNVTTEGGYPLSDATIEIVVGQTRVEVPHENLASYRRSELPAGEALLRVSAARLKPHVQTIQLRSAAPLVINVRLDQAAATGQLRGLVRSFGGQGLKAQIRVEPTGTEISTDRAGMFSIDVPPGRYEIVIDAKGHQSQRRKVEVTPDGVVILNADLSRERP